MTEAAVSVRFRARVASGPVPDPPSHRLGKNSVVTVVAILPGGPFDADRLPPRRKGYIIDEWGHFHEVFLDELLFEVGP